MLQKRTTAVGTWSSSLTRQPALQAPQYVLPDAEPSPRASSREPRQGFCSACLSPVGQCLAPLERRLNAVCLSLTPTTALVFVGLFFALAYYCLEEEPGAAVPHHEVQDLLRADYLRQHGFHSGDAGAVPPREGT